MPSAVLDSSFIASLAFRDKYSSWARKTLRGYDKLLTVDFGFAEVANVAWKRIFVFKDDARLVLENLKLAVEFMRTLDVRRVSDLIDDGIELALKLGITFYDASFIALAEREGADVLTTDLRMANAAKKRVRVVAPA